MSRQARLVISVAAEIIFAAKIYKKNDLLYFYIYNLTLKLYFHIQYYLNHSIHSRLLNDRITMHSTYLNNSSLTFEGYHPD